MAETRELTDEERAWVARMVDAATTIAAAYHLAPPPGQALEPARLDTLWRSWLMDPGFAGQDPMLFLNPFGLALGQWLVGRTGLEWRMATDELGIGVAIADAAGEVLALPVDIVRKAYESRSAAFFVDAAEDVEERLRVRRGAAAEVPSTVGSVLSDGRPAPDAAAVVDAAPAAPADAGSDRDGAPVDPEASTVDPARPPGIARFPGRD